MTKPLKTQWEFGELFPLEQTRRVYTVNEITGSIRRLLEKEFRQIWVTGEITNLRIQSSGHAYFAIKDAGAQLSCVLFRNEASGVDRELLKDGRKIIVHGELTVYETRGQYQLRVLNVEWQGQGALQAAFEKLKQKLSAEGLFAPERKRPIPKFPLRIGVVTSRDGAALHDLLHVIRRRHAGLEILLASCRVQGSGAAAEIAAAIHLLNEWASGHLPAAKRSASVDRRLDLILLTRGGGSLEDLWAFNEEVVARAIYNSHLPIISAVGHEIDFTISDFVADLRAATPSASAELITEGFFSTRDYFGEIHARMGQLMRRGIEGHHEELQSFCERLFRARPRRWLDQKTQYLDDLVTRLSRCSKLQFDRSEISFQGSAQRLRRLRPALLVRGRKEALSKLDESLRETVHAGVQNRLSLLVGLAKHLELLSPIGILKRGYSITTDARSGKVIRKSRDVVEGQILRTRLASGEIESRAEPPLPGEEGKSTGL